MVMIIFKTTLSFAISLSLPRSFLHGAVCVCWDPSRGAKLRTPYTKESPSDVTLLSLLLASGVAPSHPGITFRCQLVSQRSPSSQLPAYQMAGHYGWSSSVSCACLPVSWCKTVRDRLLHNFSHSDRTYSGKRLTYLSAPAATSILSADGKKIKSWKWNSSTQCVLSSSLQSSFKWTEWLTDERYQTYKVRSHRIFFPCPLSILDFF